jgi:hypothetical protein
MGHAIPRFQSQKFSYLLTYCRIALPVRLVYRGLVYVFPDYSLDRAFSEASRNLPSQQASFWFHRCVVRLSVLVGTCMIALLYGTYRKQYGKLRKSD